MMIGAFIGIGISAPVFWAVGFFMGIDRSNQRERADIRPALRRSVRR